LTQLLSKVRRKNRFYLWVHDGEVSIRDASHLWERIHWETEAAVRTELGDAKIHLAMIGAGASTWCAMPVSWKAARTPEAEAAWGRSWVLKSEGRGGPRA